MPGAGCTSGRCGCLGADRASRDPAPPPQLYLTQSGGIFRDMTIHDFVSKARSDELFTVTVHDGLRSLALAEAVRRSADNRVPISMSAIG
jgi:predicted dehydrogenase